MIGRISLARHAESAPANCVTGPSTASTRDEVGRLSLLAMTRSLLDERSEEKKGDLLSFYVR